MIWISLNPCSNGMPSDNLASATHLFTPDVLILVLMECPLTLHDFGHSIRIAVLILVLMECPLTKRLNN